MKITLYKYIFGEIWPTFFTSLFVFIFVVLAAKMLNISEWIVNQGVGIGQVAGMIFYLLPGMILFSLPAAALMAVFIGYLRLSNDNEILAMKSSGISIYQMLPPAIMVSFGAFLIAAFMGSVGAPWGNRSFKDEIFKVAQSRADLGIRERVFCEPFEDVTFYINSFSRSEKAMKDVFVVDRRDPSVSNTIVAKRGRILMHPTSRMFTVRFNDGTIFVTEREGKTVRTIRFSAYDLNVGLDDIIPVLSSRRKSPKEMYVPELLEGLRTTPRGEMRHNEILKELVEKASIPLAVLLMGIIGVPLGAQIRSGGRLVGIVVSLGVFFLFYMCLAAVRSLGETGALPPAYGGWVPVLFLVTSCFYLIRRAAREQSIALIDRLVAAYGS